MKCSRCQKTYASHSKAGHSFQGFVTWTEIDRVEAARAKKTA